MSIEFLNNEIKIEGYSKGEKCNRYYGQFLMKKCDGIIDEYDTDSSCTCHTGNPPCSHCVDSRLFCETCGWDGREEQMSYY